MKVEAIIGRSEEAIMNFEKVSQGVMLYIGKGVVIFPFHLFCV